MSRILQVLFFFSFLFTFSSSYASVLPQKKSKISDEKISELSSKIREFSKMSFSDFEKSLGHKANRIERYAYYRMQKKSLKILDQNGIVNAKFQKKYSKYLEVEDAGSFVGGVALGLFLGAIGLLIAYLINNNSETNDVMNGAWIGFGVLVVLLLIILISVGTAASSGF